MHATIDVRLTVSINDDKTIPLATRAEFITDQNIESVLLEGIVKSFGAACVEAPVVRNTHTATVNNASNAVVLIPAQPSKTLVITSSASTTLRILLLTTMNPVTPGPSKMFSASTGRTATSRTLQPPVPISPPHSATVMPLITARASSRGCRRQPPSTAVSENTAVSSTVSTRLCR